jgi:hypothetical protein
MRVSEHLHFLKLWSSKFSLKKSESKEEALFWR